MQGDLESRGRKVHLVPFLVPSRGQILKHTQLNIFTTMKHFKIKIPVHKTLVKNLSKVSLLCSLPIFHAFQTKEWVTPALLRPYSLRTCVHWDRLSAGSHILVADCTQ